MGAKPRIHWQVEWESESNRCFSQLCLRREGRRELNDTGASVPWWAGGMPKDPGPGVGGLREADHPTFYEPSGAGWSDPIYLTGVRSPGKPQVLDTRMEGLPVLAPAFWSDAAQGRSLKSITEGINM